MAPARLDTGWAASADAIAHVIVDTPLDDALTVGGADGHHLARARRIRAGERVTAADGRGRWRTYRVCGVASDSLALEADGDEVLEPTLEPALTVAFALTKGEKPETVVARLTELGVDRIVPVFAARSVVRWDARRGASALERFARITHEAAMQSRRARVPTLEDPAPLDHLAGRRGLVVADPSGSPAGTLPRPGPEGWTLVVGPEGGLAQEELEALEAAPRLALGPHVLRAETAAVAGAAVLTGFRAAVHPDRSGEGHGG